MFVLTGCASSAKNGAIYRVQSNFADGDYVYVIEKVEISINRYDYSDENKAALLYLKAVSYGKLADYEAKLSTLKYIVFKFPMTEYGFRAAAILEAQKDRVVPSDIEI
jgi:hypothetical protein